MRKRNQMDGETAIAFACHQFEQRHPKSTCPEWLARCTMISYHFDSNDNYIVAFSLTLIATNKGTRYFEVSVDPSTGETAVLLDEDLSAFSGVELQGFSIIE